jgi:hypothetical protein
MDNQHQKIKGYRDLSQDEIDMMNKVKNKGEELRALIAEVAATVVRPIQIMTDDASTDGEGEHALVAGLELPSLETGADSPTHWIRSADTSFRCGLMFLTRAIAQPTSY